MVHPGDPGPDADDEPQGVAPMHYAELRSMAQDQDAARMHRSAHVPRARPRLMLSLLRRPAPRPAPAVGSHAPVPRLGTADACTEQPRA
jgi:hypothetical protein